MKDWPGTHRVCFLPGKGRVPLQEALQFLVQAEGFLSALTSSFVPGLLYEAGRVVLDLVPIPSPNTIVLRA